MSTTHFEPDDPKRPDRKPPDLTTLDNVHVRRVAAFMREHGTDHGKVRADFKEFMILAWMAENDVHVSDVILVEENIDQFRRGWFFAEKLPRDARFATQYANMQTELKTLQEDHSRLLNKCAALEQELETYRP